MKRWVKVSYTVMKLNLKIVYVQDRKTDSDDEFRDRW